MLAADSYFSSVSVCIAIGAVSSFFTALCSHSTMHAHVAAPWNSSSQRSSKLSYAINSSMSFSNASLLRNRSDVFKETMRSNGTPDCDTLSMAWLNNY